MRFRMLGPLEVAGESGPIRLGRGKRRSLLALLLVHANEVVSTDRLIDALWGERPPASPRTALHVLVSELRKELGETGAGTLLTQPSGYVLTVEPAELDVAQFIGLLDGGRAALAAGDAETAEEKLRRALRLWRGPPLQDVAYEDFAQAEIARLEELRAQAEEELVDAQLACGRSVELVPRLEALIAAHPQRERLRGQLMLALYRAQRQTEALAAYQEARAMLLDELGVEPSPALRRLQQAILTQDPALEAEARPPRVSPDSPRRRRRRRSAVMIGLVAGSALAGLVVGVFFAVRGRAPTPEEPIAAVPRHSVVAIDPATGRLEAIVPLQPRPLATPVQPTDVAVGYGGVWVSDAGHQAIFRIDPKQRAVVQTIGVGADVQALAVGFGSIWVADGTSAAVTRIDPRTNLVTATIPLGKSRLTPNTTFAIAAGAGSVWATGGDRLVERIDPRENRVIERIVVPDPRTLAANARFVWCGTKNGKIVRIAPRQSGSGSQVTAFASVESGTGPIHVRGRALWVAVSAPTSEVWQYDVKTARLVSTLVAGEIVLDLAVDRAAVWVPLYREGEVIKVDATRNEIVRRIVVRPGLRSVAFDEGAVWAVVD